MTKNGRPTAADTADISLLIATYNWPGALQLCLASVARQTVLPGEVVIADDGSGEETRMLIDRMRTIVPVPIRHVWHRDDGFRLTAIRNKAIAQATGRYIIQIDGDVVLERHFIQDHIELMERGCFVCGSRTRLAADASQRMLERQSLRPPLSAMQPAYLLNSFRSAALRRYFALRYGRKIDHLRGCNMAYWKADFVAVNGYDENLTAWGHEDGELAYRLHFYGIRKKFLKMGGIVYHLWHRESPRDNESAHLQQLETVKQNRLTRCNNGIDKYL